MALADAARRFSALPPLHKKHRHNNHDRCGNKSKWLQHKPKPMKHQEVSHPDGNGGQNDDEERFVHIDSLFNLVFTSLFTPPAM